MSGLWPRVLREFSDKFLGCLGTRVFQVLFRFSILPSFVSIINLSKSFTYFFNSLPSIYMDSIKSCLYAQKQYAPEFGFLIQNSYYNLNTYFLPICYHICIKYVFSGILLNGIFCHIMNKDCCFHEFSCNVGLKHC